MKGSKKLTVRQLRELARKHLGRGHSKLKTKAELLAALKKWLPQALQALAAVQSKANALASKRTATRSRKGTPKAPPAAPVEVVTFARAEEPRAPAPPAEIPAQGQGRMGPARGGVDGAPRPAEPIIEGFFIARVAGEGEARRHHLVEGTARRSEPKARMEDGLGELPTGYEDDSLRALARDPSTLFVSWDFHPRTLERAAADMKSPRVVLRL